MGMKQVALKAAREYLRDHPEELHRALRSALGLRVGLPLAALRWLGRQAEASGKVQNLRIDAKPPGVHITAEVDLMKTPIRASCVLYIDEITISDEEVSVAIRIEEVDLEVTGPAESPVAALIKSGALDLSSPGTLAGYLPGRSPVLVEAVGSRLKLDLMKDPKIANNPKVKSIVSLLSSCITIKGISFDPGHLDIAFRAFPQGIVKAMRAVSQHAIAPFVSKILG